MTPAELAALDQDTAQADGDAYHASHALGRLIVVVAAFTVALTPAAIWPHTGLAALGLAAGSALLARLIYIAMKDHAP